MADVNDISEVLPEEDVSFLKDKHPNHVVRQVGSEIHVLLKDFAFPEQYSPRVSDLLLRLPAGYPNAAPDMFWTKPDVKLTAGVWPAQCAHREIPGSGSGCEVYESLSWQRWSRHFQGGWIVGVHGLQFFVRTVAQELKRGV
ncbi:MAG: hypothetical protein A2583_03085 [Bdellovibrionales bacterium RIFOXYD1_FULL_53_11]|nr:MAG: hypothetical protein A2583_03085 [Bdellovibrionales bacterium RIFOXYD1_FULL_53_11]